MFLATSDFAVVFPDLSNYFAEYNNPITDLLAGTMKCSFKYTYNANITMHTNVIGSSSPYDDNVLDIRVDT